MMNTQIPSGLQALLQASQVLQQQAAPTAPGPQGPQPTVANRISQQIQQTAEPQGIMPGMRDMGQQAGIAGQIMAQKQAQQQQMAQNPQAVAQMAAQMLQNQGVAGLPSNMQFKEGGIIGFSDGEEVPVPDEISPTPEERKRRRLFRRSDSEIDLGDDLYRDDTPRRTRSDEAIDLGAQATRSDTAPPPEAIRQYDRMTPERIDTALGRGYSGATADRQGIRRALEYTFKDVPMAIGRGLLGGAGTVAQHLVSAPGYGISALMDNKPVVSPATGAEPSAVWTAGPKPDKGATGAPGGEPSPAGGKPTTDSGVAALIPQPAPAVPRADIPPPPNIEDALRKYKTPEDIAKAQRDLEAADAAILARRKAAPQFEEQGIAALTRADQERRQQLAQSRAGDDWTRLRAFFRDLATRGNNYDAVQAGMDARDAGATKAALAHEQAVIELRKAKEARELGNLELERTHKANAMAFLQNERKISQELAKLEIETKAAYDKLTSTERTHFADRQSATQLEMSRQAHQAAIETAKLKQRAEELGDLRTSTALTAVLSRINQGQEALRKLAEDYPLLKITSEDAKKDPMYQAQKQQYDAAAAEIRRNLLDPAIAERDRLSAKLSGTAAPAGNVIRYDASGKKIQ